MRVLPALDLKNGNCVRLIKGNFNDVTNYNNDPINQANIFLENNFNYLHVVDLDGAQTGNQLNRSVIQKFLFRKILMWICQSVLDGICLCPSVP